MNPSNPPTTEEEVKEEGAMKEAKEVQAMDEEKEEVLRLMAEAAAESEGAELVVVTVLEGG